MLELTNLFKQPPHPNFMPPLPPPILKNYSLIAGKFTHYLAVFIELYVLANFQEVLLLMVEVVCNYNPDYNEREEK